jgi:hypothetical protein
MDNKQRDIDGEKALLPIAYCKLETCCNYTIITMGWQLNFYKQVNIFGVSKPDSGCIKNERLRSLIVCKYLLIKPVRTGIFLTNRIHIIYWL